MASNSNIQMVVGKNTFASLLEAVFNDKKNGRVFTEPIQMKVDKLEEFIDGYSTVFDEEAVIDITTHVLKVDIVSFDPTFNNVAFKADLNVLFSNPINPAFKSAKVSVSVRGSTTIRFNDKMAFILKITLDQTLVTSLQPFFSTETTREDFQKEFNKKLMNKILAQFDQVLAKGIKLPLGTHAGKYYEAKLKNTGVKIEPEFIVFEGSLDTS